jgi:hypothetical protein
VRLQEFQHEAVGEQTLVVEVVEQGVVPEGGPAFVHDLGLALRVEVLPILRTMRTTSRCQGSSSGAFFSMK